jgi:hypothetical protein
MKRIIHQTFNVFIFAYIVVIIRHAQELPWRAGDIAVASLFFGASVLAHTYRHPFLFVMLIAHMATEVFEWSLQSLSVATMAVYGVHTAMDFIFLHHELHAHGGRKSNIALLMTAGVLLVVFVTGQQFSGIVIPTIVHSSIIGGVLGCVISHLIFHSTIEKKYNPDI